jgi:hypothetical protein
MSLCAYASQTVLFYVLHVSLVLCLEVHGKWSYNLTLGVIRSRLLTTNAGSLLVRFSETKGGGGELVQVIIFCGKGNKIISSGHDICTLLHAGIVSQIRPSYYRYIIH